MRTLINRLRREDAGVISAEYAICLLVATAFAAVMLGVVTSGTVRNALTGIVTDALSLG